MIFLLMAILISQCTPQLLQERSLTGKKARHCLVTFARLNTPLPADPLNPAVSRYTWIRHHYFIAEQIQRVAKGEINRLEIEIPPRHSKTELAVRHFVPWITGKFPDRSGIVVTHTDHLAWEHGRDCRDIFLGPGYRLTFGNTPGAKLREDSQARDRLEVAGGGTLIFSGRGGLGAGLGADWMVFDDFFKNSEEAHSETVRDTAWHTFISDCQSRLNRDDAPIILIGTRRHEDDVQGRLFDPTNPHYDEREAKRWTRIRLPALAEDGDLMGRKVDEPLWPARFGFDYYHARRTHRSEIVRMDFQTQDQCNPIPGEGDYFKAKWLQTYKPTELPKHLRIYAASDHAYRKGQKNDLQCLLVVGVDASDTIWVLPDTWWHRAETDQMVEAMIGLMESRKPVCWWAARDAISGSVGPFLQKRMRERKVFAWVNDDMREDKDLERRAQSIRNRMAMGMVRFPLFAPWWPEAEKELKAFPNGKHDDLIAALALLGMGLDQMTPAAAAEAERGIKSGTLAWVRNEAERTETERKIAESTKGW